jgi:mannonate dehydratase
MHIGLGIGEGLVADETLAYAQQLSISHIIVHGKSTGPDGVVEIESLERIRDACAKHDLGFAGIENIREREHWEPIIAGTPERDRCIDAYCETLRNLSRAGCEFAGHNWLLAGVAGHWRSYDKGGGRGDAGIKSFDLSHVPDAAPHPLAPITAGQLWENMEYFLKRVVPVAEEVKVRLACHPDDPPVPDLHGTARILTSLDAFERMVDLVPSDYNGIEFCQGTFAEMVGPKVVDAIRTFGARNKIVYVHFRNVRGTYPVFDEVFIDEGDVDMFEAMKAYHEVGFDGVMRPDHTPHIAGDSHYGHRGRAYAVGYMRALMQMVEA